MITANEIVAFEHGNIRRIAVVNPSAAGSCITAAACQSPTNAFRS
jgi:hypothetical protein